MSLRALVVDDSMLIRHTVSRFLEERGFVVESVSNGKEALDRVAQLMPSLIVTDMKMPQMGGRELITALKSQPHTAGIPIIVVAGGGFDPQGPSVDYAIQKDIEIEGQLRKALAKIFGAGAAAR